MRWRRQCNEAAKRVLTRCALLLALALVTTITGCKSGSGGLLGKNKAGGTDPFLGNSPGVAAPKPPGVAASNQDPLRPLPPPPPTALTSNAALAGSTTRPLDTNNNLQIPGRPDPYGAGTPAQPVSTPPSTQPAYNPPPSNGWNGVRLNQPIPAPTPPPTTQPRSAAPPPENNTVAALTASNPNPRTVPAQPVSVRGANPAPTGGTPISYEEAQRILAAHGVEWQRLETWGDKGEWRFSCSVPNPSNQFISRNYEAKAPTYLEAMRAVIDKLTTESR